MDVKLTVQNYFSFLFLACFAVASLDACTQSKSEMNIDRFWQIIERTRGSLDEETARNRLQSELRSLSADEILSFVRHYRLLHDAADIGDVWAAGVLLNHGHGSDDGFEYFRNWLIAQGRARYEGALKDPDSLADATVEVTVGGPSAEWEGYAYIAPDVYENKTGRDVYEVLAATGQYVVTRKEPTFDWSTYTDKVMAKKLPRLWQRYGRYKIAFDAAVAKQLATEATDTHSQSVIIADLGEVTVGTVIQHRKFGPGRIMSVKSVPENRNIGTALIRFADGDHWMLIDGKSGLWELR